MKINTKLLMACSAVSLALMSLPLIFLPAEIAGYLKISSTFVIQLFIQIVGALYFAFAMLNWMAKRNVMGGIYNRPIVIANVAHFMVVGLTLLKSLLKQPDLPSTIWAVTILYTLFAAFFIIVLFQSPVANKTS